MDNFPEIKVFDPVSADERAWKAYFDHTDAVNAEIDPDDIPLPREARKGMILRAVAVPYTNKRLYLAMDGGTAAGFASAAVENPKSPSYKDNKHLVNFNLSVLPAYRRKGLGTRLVKRAAADLAAQEPQAGEFLTPVFLPSGKAFLDRLGGTVSLEQAENRLYLRDVDWAMVERWAAEGRKKNPAAELLTVKTIPEADIKDFCAVYSETMNQQPLGGISIKVAVTPEQVREGEARSAADGIEHVTFYSREADGTVSGLTEIYYVPVPGHKVKQLLTGVRVNCRGRGLGKLLKALALLYIRAAWPGVKYISTGNADSNAPMLAINDALGFKRHMPVLLYTLKLDALK